MPTRRALVCAPLMPEFDRESGSRRVFDLVIFLREAGWAVSFVAQNGRDGDQYEELLQQRGVTTYRQGDVQIKEVAEAGQFDLAICAFWHLAERYLPMIRSVSPRTRIVVDTIDLHFVRQARGTFHDHTGDVRSHNGGPRALSGEFGADVVRELNTYAAADGLMTVSDKEARIIGAFVAGSVPAYTVCLSEDLERSDASFHERQGVLFVGNFRHPPNVEAAEYLFREILPLVDRHVLDPHPVYVVGNALSETVRGFASNLSGVRMVGWVPKLQPYFEQCRLSVVPLLYGAGTKRKLIQALLLGTPSVATSIGVEGLNVKDGEHVFVADKPDAFAAAIERLLTEEDSWTRLSRNGAAQIQRSHGRGVARRQFLSAVEDVLARAAKSATTASLSDVVTGSSGVSAGGMPGAQPTGRSKYRQEVDDIRKIVHYALPPWTRVAVVSKGDPALVDLCDREGWHFPCDAEGRYIGYHPANSGEAIAHLETIRTLGANYLVIPATMQWWLDHYSEFARHLDRHYQAVVRRRGTCLIYALADSSRPGADRPAVSEGSTSTSPSAREVPRPIFIVGAPRSGTSILTWCIGQHPNIMPLEETNWIGTFGVDLGKAHERGAGRGDKSHLSASYITRPIFFEHFGGAIHKMIVAHRSQQGLGADDFMRWRDDAEPKTRWVDGTPEYSFHIDVLTELFPQATFLHLLRDVRRVVRSLTCWHRVGGPHFSEQDAYTKWLLCVRACLKAEASLGPTKVLRIEYRDLIESPRTLLERSLQFAGESFLDACLDPLKMKINSSNVAKDFDPYDARTDPGLRKEAEDLSGELLAS